MQVVSGLLLFLILITRRAEFHGLARGYPHTPVSHRRIRLWFMPKGLELHVIPTEVEGSHGIPVSTSEQYDMPLFSLIFLKWQSPCSMTT